MYNSIVQAQCVTLEELNHLFLNLEYNKSVSKNISIYRSRSFNHKNKNYLQIEEIKETLKNIDKNALKYIYITGRDCISHPDFNSILRLCLQYAPVTIYSDGSCLNDKKSRFLKRVEDEGTNEIVFKIFINHYEEKTNDEKAGRGVPMSGAHAGSLRHRISKQKALGGGLFVLVTRTGIGLTARRRSVFRGSDLPPADHSLPLPFDSLPDKQKSPRRRAFLLGDPYGNRTHVFAVRGRCLSRLTNGPFAPKIRRGSYYIIYFSILQGVFDIFMSFCLNILQDRVRHHRFPWQLGGRHNGNAMVQMQFPLCFPFLPDSAE